MPIVFATFPNGISSEYFASNMENDFESVWFVLEVYACSFKKEERERSEHSKPTTTPREVFLKIIIVTRHLTKRKRKTRRYENVCYYKRTARAAFTTASNERLRVVVTDACRNMLILLSLCKRVLLNVVFVKTKIARAMSNDVVLTLFFLSSSKGQKADSD